MVLIHKNFFSNDIIKYICNLTDVIEAKKQLESSNSFIKYFYINITSEIQQILFDKFGLNFNNIPMRWIKGDTKQHIDYGQSNFNDTYLVYLTDSEGELLIDGESYPIEKNTGYVFSEGLKHETLNTGSIPRLLLGPMSEKGFTVGVEGIYTAGGTIVYIRQNTDIQYSFDQDNWINTDYPIFIGNTDTSGGVVIVEFITDITFNDNQNKYFRCVTDYIQFGSKTLNNNGTRPIITIDGVTNYPGLIQNGNNFENGFSNIYIYNLEITTQNSSTLTTNGGWIGQEYFAKGASNCYIVNCYSDGPIIDGGGGIVGGYAASSGGNLKIIGCSSSGTSATYSGGIVGYFAGQSGGYVSCDKCWSTGIIGTNGGGIFGYSAGDGSLDVIASSCYSTGLINSNGGGIFGQIAMNGNATNCYSKGNISVNAGGIFGESAASDGGTTHATNCYSSGIITTSGNGIYGSNKQSGGLEANCYSANGSWNTNTANTQLTGIPTSPSVIGTSWIATTLNQPYELNIGYTPYTINNISVIEGVPELVITSSESINPNTSTAAAIISGKSYTILEKSGGDSGSYSTITINSTTGSISATLSTTPGIYTLYIRNTGSYNITTFDLIVSGVSPVPRQIDNSFRNYDLLLENLTNSVDLAESGGVSSYNNSFVVYDMLLLELLNNYLLNN